MTLVGRYDPLMSRSVPAFAHALGAGALCLLLWGASWMPALAATAAASEAPQDYLAQARQLASSGQRPAAIKILQDRLVTRPDDLDARTLLGIIYSWEGKYAEARTQLRQVLSDKAGYYDAMVALASLELWDDHADLALGLADGVLRTHPKDTAVMLVRARALSALHRTPDAIDALDRLLAVDPKDAAARQMRDRLADSRRAWSAGGGASGDWFSDGRQPWQETWLGVKRQTGVGSFSFTAQQAKRWDERDEQYEVEAYPRIRPGTYMYLDGGWASKATLYPEYRFGAYLYQSLGRGFEGSFGYSRLGFGDGVDIYIGSLSKYLGSWLFMGQIFVTPNATGTNVSYHGAFRYYFRDRQYFGARYHYGAAKERISTINDLLILNAQGVSADTVFQLGRRFEFTLRGAYEDQERPYGGNVKQYTGTASLYVRF